jgi:acyl-CoA synthetase (AMP-forming)/AMP-acid ligase II
MPDLPCLHHIHDYLFYHAERQPGERALVCGGETTTYQELADRVQACAAALVTAGVRPGDRVAALCLMQTEFLVTFLATSMVGGIWMGLNPRYQARELDHILRDAQPVLLFTVTRPGGHDLAPELLELFAEIPGLDNVITLDEPGAARFGRATFSQFVATGDGPAACREAKERAAMRTARDPVLLVYTSGTTGRPKGALLTHEGLIGRAMTQARIWPCDPIRILNFLSINHIGGVGFISFYCLVGGGTQFLLPRFHPAEVATLLRSERITIWIGLPTIFLMVLEQPAFDPTNLPDLQWAVWSGAAMPLGSVKTLRAIGCRIGSSYGLTESSGSVCYASDDLSDEVLADSIGQPMPAGEARLADPAGRPVPRGEPGEIQVRPEWTMKGYLNLERESIEARTGDGFVRTGDIGVEDAAGNIKLVGRTKEMFKSGGYNVYPREVELAIEQHPQIAICAVVPVADPRYQEVGVAFVQCHGKTSLSAQDLRAWCAGRLANYKVPKQFHILDRLPMLSIAKVDRRALQTLATEQITGPVGAVMENCR